MPTTKSRLNITLSDDAKRAIAQLAKRDNIPDATLAARLIETALELEEDIVWEKVVSERQKTATKFLSHDEVWQ